MCCSTSLVMLWLFIYVTVIGSCLIFPSAFSTLRVSLSCQLSVQLWSFIPGGSRNRNYPFLTRRSVNYRGKRKLTHHFFDFTFLVGGIDDNDNICERNRHFRVTWLFFVVALHLVHVKIDMKERAAGRQSPAAVTRQSSSFVRRFFLWLFRCFVCHRETLNNFWPNAVCIWKVSIC